MRFLQIRATSSVVIFCAAMAAGYLAWSQVQSGRSQAAARERARTAFAHALPKMDGDRLKATLVEVNYGPGESSSAHSHPCPVIGYVLEGEIRSQVKGEPEAIYKAGESFYEPPNGVHLVSGNASQTRPARLLAYFLCDHDAPLSTAAPEAIQPGGN
jgi:quercetin dioxygenase-like cupin family protein